MAERGGRHSRVRPRHDIFRLMTDSWDYQQVCIVVQVWHNDAQPHDVATPSLMALWKADDFSFHLMSHMGTNIEMGQNAP